MLSYLLGDSFDGRMAGDGLGVDFFFSSNWCPAQSEGRIEGSEHRFDKTTQIMNGTQREGREGSEEWREGWGV